MSNGVLLKKTEPGSRNMAVSAALRELKTALVATLLLVILLCGIYPVLIWGIAQLAFPDQANGSLIERNGKVVGSSLIAQAFTSPGYFHPRPSAAGDGYDAANSGGSNLGPLSQELIDQVRERVASYRLENNLSPDVVVPADAVTSSGSGLDPQISVKNAELQAARVAAARGITGEEIRKVIARYTEGPQLGFLGDPRVNVLRLNLALDALSQGASDGRRQGS